MTVRFIGKTYKEYQRELIEHFKNGKEIRDFWTCRNVKKRPQAPKPILLGLGSEKYGNQVPNFEKNEKYIKDAPNKNCAEWVIRFSKRAREVPE